MQLAVRMPGPSRSQGGANQALLSVHGMISNIQAGLAAAYVAIAGTYWLPGIPPSYLALGKIAAFGILALLAMPRIRQMERGTAVFCVVLGLCAVLGMITGSLTEGVASGVDILRNFAEPLIWLIALEGMNERARRQFLRLLKIFLVVASVLIFYVLAAYFEWVADLATPLELSMANPLAIEGSTISNSGFTGSRTGWGAVVGTTAILTAVLLMDGARRWSGAVIFAVLIVAAALVTTMIAGARGGAFALLAAVALGVASAQQSRYTNMIVVGALVALLVYFGAFSIVPELFFRRLDATGSFVERLDALSTGRISSYWQGLGHWISSPLIGVGPENALVWVNQGERLPVHNVWLRVLAESGLVVGIPVFWMTGRWLRLIRVRPVPVRVVQAPPFWPPLNVRLVLVCGLVLAMVEPSVIFGSFNSNLAIWTAIWMLLKREAFLKSAAASAAADNARLAQTSGR